MNDIIPFTKPYMVGTEFSAIQTAIANSELSGDGAYTKKCHSLLERSLGVKKALLTTSCTHALEMAAILLEIEKGDEVIVPSFTFVSTANAFALRGAKIIFADVRPDTLNLDETKLEKLITSRTRIITPVHYAGVACEMDTILKIADRHGIAVVEDNAHGLFGRYRGHYLGTMGTFGTQSFHETKNLTMGEGGSLLINDLRYVHRAELIREKGTDRSAFYRGEVDKYTWRDIGSSYLPSGILAAYLYAQLSSKDIIQNSRANVWNTYDRELFKWATDHRVQTITVPEGCEQPYHMYWMLLPSFDSRAKFIAHMSERGVKTTFHYGPLNTSPFGKTFGEQHCPITEDISDRLIRLPLFAGMTEPQLQRVVSAVKSFRPF